MNRKYIALGGRIAEALHDLAILTDRTERQLEKARHDQDDDYFDYFDAVALNLHGFYSGVEAILVDIARTVDESMPDSPNWHRELLLQMGADLADVRPAVITDATRICLDEYLRFRHVVRNAYSFTLRTSRLEELAEELPDCVANIQSDLQRFRAFLETAD